MKLQTNQRINRTYLLSTLVLILFLQLNYTYSQSHNCGVHEELAKYQNAHPKEYQLRLAKYNSVISNNVRKVKQLKNSEQQGSCPNGITVLPIAFHVFHSGDTEGSGFNYSRDDLRLVVDQLNSDFSGYSYLKDDITGDFESFEAGHTCIQFAIGKINRIDTKTCNYWEIGATHSVLNKCLPGGSGVGSENDPNDYLNIYITDMKSGYLGIASSIPALFGRVNGNDDGVTINQDIVIPGKSGYIYNRGSVLAHEVGHWLGLPHVNGDINGSGCGADDGFTDTYPQSAQRFFYCNSQEIPSSCGSVDNIFNFMDYSADCAKLMFTEEQAMTMQNILETERRQLAGSFARGNEDRQEYNTSCKSFEANSQLFEYVLIDCHSKLNLLEYQTMWYPSSYNSDNAAAGLSLFTWQKENRGEPMEIIAKKDLYKLPVAHDSEGYNDIHTYNLYIQCWDPYKKTYSAKQPAGKVMIIIKRCPPPANDDVADAQYIGFGADCYESDYVLNNATPTTIEALKSSEYKTVNDVWFKTNVPEQVGMTVEVNRVNRAIEDPMIEAYVMRGQSMDLIDNPYESVIELNDLVAGEDIYFRVFNQSNSDLGAFYICMTQMSLNNNTCSTAATLEVSDQCEAKTYHNYGASASGYPSNMAICGRTDKALDTWYTLTVPSSGQLFVESFMVDNGVTEIIMEAYAGGCDNLEPIACSSIKEYWPVYDRHGLIELFDREPGEEILIRLFGGGTVPEGEFGLCAYGGKAQTSCRISLVEPLEQFLCMPNTSTYEQSLRITYRNSGNNEYLFVNNQSFKITGSPQVITLVDLPADNRYVNVSANIGNSTDDLCWQQSFYKAYSLFAAPAPCLADELVNDECFGAIELSVSDECNREIYSNNGSTYSVGMSEFFSCGVSGYRPDDVWFKAQIPTSGNLTISAPLLYNENNMILEAYVGTCDALMVIDCDQFGGPDGSIIELTNQEPGEYIYIRVVDQGNNTKGDFAMCVYSTPNARTGFVAEQSKELAMDHESEEVISSIVEDVINIYPNPTTDFITVDLSGSGNRTIILSDITGKEFKRMDSGIFKSIKMDVRSLPVGHYLLTIMNNDQISTKQVMIL